MTLLIVSFVAGVLTILAPCVLPLLPVIVGGSVARAGTKQHAVWYRPLVIAASLALSIIVFSLLLKATTALLGIPIEVWQVLSGVIIILFGVSMVFPKLWEEVMIVTRFQARSNQLLGKSSTQGGLKGDILLGMALGPVFSSCSPTFALIVAAVLPVSFAEGLLYLIAYSIGLSAMLLLVALTGHAVVKKLGWALNSEGWFNRIVGIVFIVVGLALLVGFDKRIQSFVLEQGWYDPISQIEESFRR